MKWIDQEYFKNKFNEIFGNNYDIISTIDHPFSSPPIRIIDGHWRLRELNKSHKNILICIWDVNKPDIKHYRTDLSFDLGILATRHQDFQIFRKGILYPFQKPNKLNFSDIKYRLGLVLKHINAASMEYAFRRQTQFLQNFDKLAILYDTLCRCSINGTEFYKTLMINFYKFLDLPIFCDLGMFVQNNYTSYYDNQAFKN